MAEDEKDKITRLEITRLKIKLAEILNELGWLMPEDEFYETFPDTLQFIEGYF